MPLKIAVASSRGRLWRGIAQTVELRTVSSITQFMPGGKAGYASFDRCRLDIWRRDLTTRFDFAKGFASFEDGTLTVLVEDFSELTRRRRSSRNIGNQKNAQLF